LPTLIEIGPGRGALTDHLLHRAERLIAIEVDTVWSTTCSKNFKRTRISPSGTTTC
jgi:Dimethyladenosine transferase (rRNA methylation)